MRRDASRSDSSVRREAARVDWGCQSRRFDRVDFRGTNWSCDDKRATLLIRPRATVVQFSQESLPLSLFLLCLNIFLLLNPSFFSFYSSSSSSLSSFYSHSSSSFCLDVSALLWFFLTFTLLPACQPSFVIPPALLAASG